MGTAEKLGWIRLRPTNFGLDGSFRGYVAFLQGYSIGWRDRDGETSILDGFSAWLAPRVGGGANVIWWALVLKSITPPGSERPSLTADLGPALEAQAVDRLFELLNGYLQDRDRG